MNNNLSLDLSKVPNELKLIIEVIKNEKLSHIPNESYKDIDWGAFLKLALHHRVYPLLFLRLIKIEHGLIPLETLESLSKYYKNNTIKMLQLSAEMEKLSKLFLENKICPLFLKGPVLGADLYGDISMRTSGDLDILVSIHDLEKVNGLLEEQGYKKDEYIQTLLNDWKWRHHHFTYYHPSKRTKIEIHWRLNPAPSKEPTFTELWGRKRRSTISSTPIYFLSKEDLFCFLITHGARHGWSRLRWLLDIHQITQKDLDWTVLKNLQRRFQIGHIAGQSIILSSQLFNTILNKDMYELGNKKRPQKIAQEAIFYLETMVNLHIDNVPENISKYHSRHLFSLMSYQQKIAFFMIVLHPYYTDAQTLPLPEKFHFLYYPLRPFLWIWRKTRKQALS
jgi:hypothetical protein